jgi:hypothetical protein
MLQLCHDFYNIIFKIKYKLHAAPWSAPPHAHPQLKIVGVHLVLVVNSVHRCNNIA